MISAVVLVNTQTESGQEVIKHLRQIDGVVEAHALYGVYDFIVKIRAQSIDKMKELIRVTIRKIVGVTDSLTLMIVKDQSQGI